jgi:hypothetical protein
LHKGCRNIRKVQFLALATSQRKKKNTTKPFYIPHKWGNRSLWAISLSQTDQSHGHENLDGFIIFEYRPGQNKDCAIDFLPSQTKLRDENWSRKRHGHPKWHLALKIPEN